MKKKAVLAMMVATLFCTACGSNVTQAVSTAVDAKDGAVTVVNNETSEEDVAQVEVEASGEGTEETTTTAKVGGYFFNHNGKQIQVGMTMEEITNAIGEANSVFEAASCAFDGMARQYNYGSIEIVTYEDAGVEKCCSIYLNDDMAQTEEGVYIGMSKEDMENTYGTGYVEDGGICTYVNGGMELRFTMAADGKISFIEYALPNPQ